MTKQKKTKAATTSTKPLDKLAAWFDQSNREVDIIILVFVALLSFITFANTVDGNFVYDDTRQILQNPIVRDSDQFWSAFSTDVWAFKSGGSETVSDYWRPIFILWLVVNERLFGLESTAGWHLSNILLHIGTAVLSYILLRQIKLTRPIATAIVLVFALHPAHVETVAWISGAPDLLMGITILGAISLLFAYQKTADRRQYIAALLLFSLALLSKEAAVLFPVLVLFIFYLWPPDETTPFVQRAIKSVRMALPFVLFAIVYLAVRVAVLGYLAADRPWQRPIIDVILTMPSVITFYLRQSIIPIEIGPSYPLRVLNPTTINLQYFWFPILLTTFGLTLFWWLFRRSNVKVFGLTLYILFLLPSFNVNAFHPEQIVHDRYLYLPLLGLLIIAIPLLNSALGKLANHAQFQSWNPAHFRVVTMLVTAVLCLPLLFQTIRYNTAWKTDLALWEWGIQSDPSSVFNNYQYGYYLFRNDRLAEAKEQMDMVISSQPLSGPYYSYLQAIEAHLERADIAINQEKFDEARADLVKITMLSPSNLSEDDRANLDAQQQRGFERLALSYLHEGDWESATETLETARQTLPQLKCTFTTNLAVTLYLSDQKEAALTELEGIQNRIDLEFTPLCKMSLFYLGQLYLELGQTAEAQRSLSAFLKASEPFYDTQTLNLRQQAEQILGQISG